MSAPYTSLDALKYLAVRVRSTVDWTLDSLSGNGVSGDEHHELEAIEQMSEDMKAVLGPLAEVWNRYSDGREVLTSVEIEHGHRYEHLWHPDPAVGEPTTVVGKLSADPGEDRGRYEIHIVPPQSVTVQVFPRQLRVVAP